MEIAATPCSRRKARPGEGFRAEVCRQFGKWRRSWLRRRGSGSCCCRFGVVVGPGGGLLRRLILPARLGFGARFGDGSQFMSWISLADAVGAVLHAAGEEALSFP